MAFGVDYTGFLDSFDTGKVVGTGAQARAKELANSFLDAAKVGGAGVDTIGQTRAKELLRDAQQSAKSTTNTASAVSGGLDFLGSVGSFAAAGGFGGAGAVGGDGGAAAGLTMPGNKGYDFFKSGTPSFGGDFTYDFGGMASNMGY
jgi:hypothetical protein